MIVSITEIMWGSSELMSVKCLTKGLAHSKGFNTCYCLHCSAVLGETELKTVVAAVVLCHDPVVFSFVE